MSQLPKLCPRPANPAWATPGEILLLCAAVKPLPGPPGVVCGYSAAFVVDAGFETGRGLFLSVGSEETSAASLRYAARYPFS